MLNVNTGSDTVKQQLARLKTILQEVNMDGDKYISRTEMALGLSLVEVSLDIDALATTPLWCHLASDGCYTTAEEMARMPVDTILQEASMAISLFGSFTPAVGLVVSALFREPSLVIRGITGEPGAGIQSISSRLLAKNIERVSSKPVVDLDIEDVISPDDYSSDLDDNTAKIAHPVAASVTLLKDEGRRRLLTNSYFSAANVGGWGGTCTCPDGQEYLVGDNEDSCETLACVGGVSGSCDSSLPASASGKKVVCAEAPAPTPPPTNSPTTPPTPPPTNSPTSSPTYLTKVTACSAAEDPDLFSNLLLLPPHR
jgi:hypothetical protein